MSIKIHESEMSKLQEWMEENEWTRDDVMNVIQVYTNQRVRAEKQRKQTAVAKAAFKKAVAAGLIDEKGNLLEQQS